MVAVLLTQDLIENKSISDKRQIVWKLHRQFSHADSGRIKSLLRNAGINDSDYFSILDEISETCDTCKHYKRAHARPIVGLSMAKTFNETVAMDLKEGTKGNKMVPPFS